MVAHGFKTTCSEIEYKYIPVVCGKDVEMGEQISLTTIFGGGEKGKHGNGSGRVISLKVIRSFPHGRVTVRKETIGSIEKYLQKA